MKIKLPVWADRRWIKCPYCGMTDKARKWLKHDTGVQTIAMFNDTPVKVNIYTYSCPECFRIMGETQWKYSQFKGGMFRPGNGFEVR